jgi:hypothetical protein
MSWHYSRALEAAYSAENYLDGAPSAPLNTTNTQETCSRQDRTTDASNHSQYGTTLQPLTENLGTELLTWFLAGFHARTSALLVVALDSKENEAVYGEKWRASWVKYDPLLFSWKTHQCLWQEDLSECSVTLPNWGMMQDGVVLEQMMSDCRTEEIGSGWWPTPTKFDAILANMMPKNGDSTRMDKHGKQRKVLEDGRTASMGFSRLIISMTGRFPKAEAFEELMGWPTGWTGLRESATDKFQGWLKKRGKH